MRGQYFQYPSLCSNGTYMRGQYFGFCDIAGQASLVTDGLILHLDAYDSSTMTLTGNRVDEWRDKQGGSVKVATNSDLGVSFNPTYDSTLFRGNGGVLFSFPNAYLQTPTDIPLNNNDGFTIISVIKRKSRDGFWMTTDYNRNPVQAVFLAERMGIGNAVNLKFGVPQDLAYIHGTMNDGGVVKFIRNGIAYPKDDGAFNFSSGAFGKLSVGGWQGTGNGATFELAQMFVYNRTLTAGELLTMDSYIKETYTINEVPEPTWNLLVDGNSHTLGVGGTNVSTINEGVLAANDGPLATDWLALGTSGATTPQLITAAPTKVDPLYDSSISANKRILIFWEGTNHIANTVSADETIFYNAIKEYCEDRKTANPAINIIVGTIMPRQSPSNPDYETVRLAVNDLIRDALTNNEPWLDAIADVGGDATIGATGAAANATYFGDGLHLTDAGQTIAKTYFTSAINTISGL